MIWQDSPVWLCSLVRKVRRPIVGIMARPRIVQGQLAGKQGPVLLKYLETARRLNTLACVFDPSEVDCARGRLEGYILDPSARREQPRVEKVDLPIPLVIYDQILSRRYEKSKTVSVVRTFLKQQAKVFNDGYFDKWEVHEWLLTCPELHPFLPKTEELTSVVVLRRFLLQHPVIFIKPIHGSLGLGIMKVTRQDEHWQAVLRSKEGNEEEYSAASAQELFTRYRKRWVGSPHIVQQGLPLYTVDDRPVDIRVIMQKNQNAEWHSTKLFVRMAGSGEFISNLTTGGEAFSLSQLALVDKSLNLPKIKRAIRQLVDSIPGVIEEASGRLLGELGIDVGLCSDSKTYIIEVNSKPWKTPETVNGSVDLVELSFERPIRFAHYLAQGLEARGDGEK